LLGFALTYEKIADQHMDGTNVRLLRQYLPVFCNGLLIQALQG
jgi:hypothetical protein